MYVIGLCGGSGSGKGSVSAIFSAHGIPSIDTDKVYRDLTSTSTPCLSELVAEFGEGILNDKGGLNRKALAAIVFGEPDGETRRLRLNEISHKHIINKTEQIISEYSLKGYNAAVVDAPLLYESGLDKRCNTVVAVIADRKTRISRICSRDGISEQAAIGRISSQIGDVELSLKSDHIIYNNGGLEELEVTVSELINKLKEEF